jgi:hypothetical protein
MPRLYTARIGASSDRAGLPVRQPISIVRGRALGDGARDAARGRAPPPATADAMRGSLARPGRGRSRRRSHFPRASL